MLHVIHMNGEHPLDDLFARGLRHAEAEPPASVWAGIQRKRGAGHRFALFLRKRWTLGLLLLLLLGSGASYALFRGSGPERVAQHEATDAPRTERTSSTVPGTPGTPARAAAMQEGSEENGHKALDPGHDREATNPVGTSGRSSTPTTPDGPPEVAPVHHAPAGHDPHSSGQNTLPGSTGSVPAAPASKPLPADRSEVLDRTAQHDMAERMPLRPTVLEQLEQAATPGSLPHPAYASPRGSWWFGLYGAAYSENRTWHGGDPDLRHAAQRTEVPHYPTGVGLVMGRSWRSGHFVTGGLERVGSRVDFRHLDRIRTEQLEVHQVIVTLDANVIFSSQDTVLTVREQNIDQQSVNRYTTFRVPLEYGFRKHWRRWHYGGRLGLALEHISQRQGFTLQLQRSGDQANILSVAADQDLAPTLLLAGSLGLDLGFSVTEHLSLDLVPYWSSGMVPISSPQPHFRPERLGVRFGLTYHIPHP